MSICRFGWNIHLNDSSKWFSKLKLRSNKDGLKTMLASGCVVKKDISVKFMRWKNFEGLFGGFFSFQVETVQELLSAERRTHLLFLSILKEVNWFPVRFSTVINGSLFYSVQGPRCQKYLTISSSSKHYRQFNNFDFMNFLNSKIFAVFWFLKVEAKVRKFWSINF